LTAGETKVGSPNQPRYKGGQKTWDRGQCVRCAMQRETKKGASRITSGKKRIPGGEGEYWCKSTEVTKKKKNSHKKKKKNNRKGIDFDGTSKVGNGRKKKDAPRRNTAGNGVKRIRTRPNRRVGPRVLLQKNKSKVRGYRRSSRVSRSRARVHRSIMCDEELSSEKMRAQQHLISENDTGAVRTRSMRNNRHPLKRTVK